MMMRTKKTKNFESIRCYRTIVFAATASVINFVYFRGLISRSGHADSILVEANDDAKEMEQQSNLRRRQSQKLGRNFDAAIKESSIVASDDVDPTDCAAFTPECEPDDVIAKRWGESILKVYSQSDCCSLLGQLRIAIPEVFRALEQINLTAWVTGGTALGVARHHGRLIPWDFDGDIAFYYSDTDDKSFWSTGMSPPVIIKRTRDVTSIGEQVTKSLNNNLQGNAAKWTYNVLHEHDIEYCVAIKLIKFHHDADTNTTSLLSQIDLFGKKHHMEPKVIDGILRQSVNNPSCFRHAKNHDEHSYYMLPPTKCQFYDTIVWCPRDIVGLVENYYGKDVLSKAVSHDGFYGKEYGPGTGNGE